MSAKKAKCLETQRHVTYNSTELAVGEAKKIELKIVKLQTFCALKSFNFFSTLKKQKLEITGSGCDTRELTHLQREGVDSVLEDWQTCMHSNSKEMI